ERALSRVSAGQPGRLDLRRCWEHSFALETSDLRPDESTTNIGLFKAGTSSILKHVDQPLLTLVGPDESFSAQPGSHAMTSRPTGKPAPWSLKCGARGSRLSRIGQFSA